MASARPTAFGSTSPTSCPASAPKSRSITPARTGRRRGAGSCAASTSRAPSACRRRARRSGGAAAVCLGGDPDLDLRPDPYLLRHGPRRRLQDRWCRRLSDGGHRTNREHDFGRRLAGRHDGGRRERRIRSRGPRSGSGTSAVSGEIMRGGQSRNEEDEQHQRCRAAGDGRCTLIEDRCSTPAPEGVTIERRAGLD